MSCNIRNIKNIIYNNLKKKNLYTQILIIYNILYIRIMYLINYIISDVRKFYFNVVPAYNRM